MDPKKDYLEKLGYETRDIVARTIAKWIAGLFVFLIATFVVIYFVYNAMLPPTVSRVAGPFMPVRQLPPAPRLQPRPGLDLRAFRAQEDANLKSYAIDPKTGVVRIPIDRAIDLTAQRGLPIEGQTPAH